MSKIEEIKKIKKQLEEALKDADIPNNKNFQDAFYKLYEDWVKMKGEWEKEQEKKRKELEEKYGERKELEKESEEVAKAYSDVEKAVESKIKSLSDEIASTHNNLQGLKSAYKKAYELKPTLSEFADEDKQRLGDISAGIAQKREFVKMLEELLSLTKDETCKEEKGED